MRQKWELQDPWSHRKLLQQEVGRHFDYRMKLQSYKVKLPGVGTFHPITVLLDCIMSVAGKSTAVLSVISDVLPASAAEIRECNFCEANLFCLSSVYNWLLVLYQLMCFNPSQLIQLYFSLFFIHVSLNSPFFVQFFHLHFLPYSTIFYPFSGNLILLFCIYHILVSFILWPCFVSSLALSLVLYCYFSCLIFMLCSFFVCLFASYPTFLILLVLRTLYPILDEDVSVA